MTIKTTFLVLLFVYTMQAFATEYFVSKQGADTNNGRSVATAFHTIGKGISVLKPGDTLTILPGDYFESIRARLSGRPDAPITIRAHRPGTVLLRGDMEPPRFQLLEGTRYTWVATTDKSVEGVGERDTFKIYSAVPSIPEVEDLRGSFFYDPAARRLYVHTTDSGHPDSHALSISVTCDFGLLIQPPAGEKSVHDVVIDGLAFTGYQTREMGTIPGMYTKWGLYLAGSGEGTARCVIRRCTAFLNGGGIGLCNPTDGLIEHCLAFGNYSTYCSSGGNIICWTPASNTVLRNNVAHSTKSNGIRFYGGGAKNCLEEGNLVYDCMMGEIWIKGGDCSTSRMLGNIALGALHNSGGVAPGNIRNNICHYGSNLNDDGSNIILSSISRLDLDKEFADPVHHDYRLQSDSRFRGKGPNGSDPGPHPYRDEVFFVKPDGDDAAPGTSVKLAWKTIRKAASSAQPGQTVYILAGTYAESLMPAHSGAAGKPIIFRRRGRDRVVLDGRGVIPIGVDLNSRSHIIVEGLRLERFKTQGIRVNGGDSVNIESCIVTQCGEEGILATRVKDLVIRHCLVRGNANAGLRLAECEGTEVTGNIFDINGTAALGLDKVSATSLWSDRNNFVPAPSRPCVQMDGKDYRNLAAWQRESRLDINSLSVEPGYQDADKSDFSLKTGALLIGRGPLASHIGPYATDKRQVPLRIEDVKVHSVTSSTANIEWWTPTAEAITNLEWGETPDCKNKIENINDASIFHTVSLCGLKPNTKYYYRISAITPAYEFHTNTDLAHADQEKPRAKARMNVASFTTLAKDPPPRTLHVAVTGNDKNDGLSRATAWRTLRHAAASVRAGDTVLIHGGTYEEHVPLRATGDANAPITFRAAPGEQVWLDGSGQKRNCALRIAFKHHIILDGFYLHNFRASSYQTAETAGAIEIVGGSHNVVRRCFYDGRAKNYMPYAISAQGVTDLLVENCVIIQGWNGAYFHECPNLNIRHCVFYNCQIQAINVMNTAEQPFTLSHNILCDNIPQKYRNPIVSLWHLECLRANHNCYFVRLPATERKIISYSRFKGEKNNGQLVLAELQNLSGQEKNSIFANPGMRVVPEMRMRDEANPEEAKVYMRVELHKDGDKFNPLDFSDFFAAPTGPCAKAADGAPIGLDPKAFTKE